MPGRNAREVVIATDSLSPSGVGRHMLILATALGAGWRPRLLFPDHAEGAALVREARSSGLNAAVVAQEGWAQTFRGAGIIHIHAGIGWEGHALVDLAAAAGGRIVRTEHLPWLLTNREEIDAYAGRLGAIAAIIAVSEAGAADWRGALGKLRVALPEIHAVPNGIHAVEEPRPVPECPTILCVARLSRQKNHDVLLGAFAKLRRRSPTARLLLAGEGPEEARLRRRADRLGLEAVEFLGQRQDVPRLLASADLLVLASAFEGLPLVVLEAMAAGTPVIATRIGGVCEVLGDDHPWLVPPGDRRALSDAMSDALSDPAARAATAQRQRSRYEAHYTADRMGRQTAAIYERSVSPLARGSAMTTRLGFIGAGGIAHRHFDVLTQMEDVRIAAVADPDAGRAAAAAAKLGAEVFSDHDAMLAGVELDAVYICVPPFAHGDPERACLARNLPFFVEKPVTLDLDLAEDLGREIHRRDLVTAVGYHWRYLDTVEAAREELVRNPPHLMTGFWLDQTPPPQWWWDEGRSGGQVVEQASHIIDLARFLAGDVTEVFGAAARRDREDFGGLSVATASAATLRFASGAIANLSATCLLRWNHRVGLHVFSDALAIEITDHDVMIDVGRGRPVRPAQGDPVWREDRDFIDAVQGRENRIRCPYAEALKTHRVAHAVARSARDREIVRMEALRADPQPFFRVAVAQGAPLAS